MKTMIVDDESMVLEQVLNETEDLDQMEIVGAFTDPAAAMGYARGQKSQGVALDVALLDIEMPGMNGIQLAKGLRGLYPEIIIIFMTGHDRYAVEAVHLPVDYYMLKPCDRVTIRSCMRRAGRLAVRHPKHLYARTFGRFDLFADGQLVVFHNAKAKELLALCIDHQGGDVTMEEAIDKLWEDRTYDSRVKQRYRTTVMQLKKTLEDYHAGGLFHNQRGRCHIDRTLLDCDYYDLLEGQQEALRLFDDQYMTEYSWAEETLGSLFNFLDT